MKTSKIKAFLLLLFIILTFYVFGVNTVYFLGNYESWKEVGPQEFVVFYDLQADIIYNIIFMPTIILSVVNLILLPFKPSYVNIGLLIISMVFVLVNWICVYYWQIPLHEELAKGKSLTLIEELLKTETIRYSANSVQFLAVTFMLWKTLSQLSPKKR